MALADGDNVEGGVGGTADSGDGADRTDKRVTGARAASERWTGRACDRGARGWRPQPPGLAAPASERPPP